MPGLMHGILPLLLNSFVLNVHLYFPISSASPIFGLFSFDLVLLLTFLTIHIFITKYFSSARIRFVHSAQGWSCRTPPPALAFRTPALTNPLLSPPPSLLLSPLSSFLLG